MKQPEYISTDLEQIVDEMILYYEGKTGKTLYPAQLERLLLDVLAYRESMAKQGWNLAACLNLVNYSRNAILEELGALVGVTRNVAAKAVTTLRFQLVEARPDAYVVPVGSQLATSDGFVVFSTTEAGIIPAGMIACEVAAECTAAGAAGNGYIAGTVKQLVTPLQYIDPSKCYNITTTAGGADIESDDTLRQRIKLAPSSFSTAGPDDAYIFWAKTASQSIVDVTAASETPGEADIYILTDTGLPTPEIIEKVQTILSAKKTRPLTDHVVVKAPAEVRFAITGTLYIYAHARYKADAIMTEVKALLQKYCAEMEKRLGIDVIPEQLIEKVMEVDGVYRIVFTAPVYRRVSENEWAHSDGTIEIDLSPEYEHG